MKSAAQGSNKITKKDVRMSTNPVASLLFQKTIFYEFYWNFIYVVFEIICFSFKSNYLNYSSGFYGIDVTVVVCFVFGIFVRNSIGNVGNKTEDSGTIMKFLLLSVLVIFIYLYLMLWQTLVLKFELFLNIIGIVIASFSTVFSILGYLSAAKAEKTQ